MRDYKFFAITFRSDADLRHFALCFEVYAPHVRWSSYGLTFIIHCG